MIDRCQEPYWDEHQRAMEAYGRMTIEEKAAVFRRAGILDEEGHLAARYREGAVPVPLNGMHADKK